jgi:hypothetical protein
MDWRPEGRGKVGYQDGGPVAVVQRVDGGWVAKARTGGRDVRYQADSEDDAMRWAEAAAQPYTPRPYIAAQHWVFAKSMPDNAHFYVLLKVSTDREAHLDFLSWIRQGRSEVWQGRRYHYRVVDGWRYWALGPWDTIINRRAPYLSTACSRSVDHSTHDCDRVTDLPELAERCECSCHGDEVDL